LSQPTLRREGEAWLAGACPKKGIRAESPPTFIWGKHRKTRKRRDLQTFNQMSKYDFNLYSFPFLGSYVFFMPFYVFIFLWSTRVFPFAPTYSSIVIRKSDLHSYFVNKVFWLNYFLSFFARYVFLMKGHLRRWTIRQSFDSFEKWENIKALDH